METTITSVENWKKFVDTGENSLLGDVDAKTIASGSRAVLAGEGWEREIVFT